MSSLNRRIAHAEAQRDVAYRSRDIAEQRSRHLQEKLDHITGKRAVETPEQLAELPMHTVILDADGEAYQRFPEAYPQHDGWWTTGGDYFYPPPALPALVLHVPATTPKETR